MEDFKRPEQILNEDLRERAASAKKELGLALARYGVDVQVLQPALHYITLIEAELKTFGRCQLDCSIYQEDSNFPCDCGFESWSLRTNETKM